MLFTAALPFPARACGTNWSWSHGTDHTLSGQTLPNLPGLSGNRQDQFLLRAVSSAELKSCNSVILCTCSLLLLSLGHLSIHLFLLTSSPTVICLAEFIWDRKLFQTENSVSCVVSLNIQKQCPEVSFGFGRRLMMGWFCFECIIVHHTNRITESLGLQKTSKIIKPNTPVPTKPFHEVPHLFLHIPSPL